MLNTSYNKLTYEQTFSFPLSLTYKPTLFYSLFVNIILSKGINVKYSEIKETENF